MDEKSTYTKSGIRSYKRFPVVLCLDISSSMKNEKRIHYLNQALEIIYKELGKDQVIADIADIAVVTFGSDIIECSGKFESLSEVSKRTFSASDDDGCQLSKAILHSIRLLEERVELMDSCDIDFYLPCLMVITGGDPDGLDDPASRKEAMQAILKHCENSVPDTHLITTYIIEVGNDVSERCSGLDQLTEGFTEKTIILSDSIDELSESLEGMFGFRHWDFDLHIHENKYPLKMIYKAIKEYKQAIKERRFEIAVHRRSPSS